MRSQKKKKKAVQPKLYKEAKQPASRQVREKTEKRQDRLIIKVELARIEACH